MHHSLRQVSAAYSKEDCHKECYLNFENFRITYSLKVNSLDIIFIIVYFENEYIHPSLNSSQINTSFPTHFNFYSFFS